MNIDIHVVYDNDYCDGKVSTKVSDVLDVLDLDMYESHIDGTAFGVQVLQSACSVFFVNLIQSYLGM